MHESMNIKFNNLKIMWRSPIDSGFSKQESEKGLDVVVIVFFFVLNVRFIFAAVTLKMKVHIMDVLLGENTVIYNCKRMAV